MNQPLPWQGVVGTAALASLFFLSTMDVTAAGVESAEKPPLSAASLSIPKRKQTSLGLYVTAKEAYEKWRAAPDEVKVIDVRTPEEFAFVGHPEMAWNVPLAFVTYQSKGGQDRIRPEDERQLRR